MKIGVILALACLFMTACDSTDRPPANKSRPPAAAVQPRASDHSPDDAPGGGGPVAILLPSPLTSADTAQVRVKGCSGKVQTAWSVNGSPVGDSSATLANANFVRGDEVSVRIDCNGLTGETTAQVVNSPPRVIQASFADPSFGSGQDVEVVPEAFDQDGDDIWFSYQWKVDGEEITVVDGPVLPGEYVQRDKGIELTIIPSDPFESGPQYRGLVFHPVDSAPKFVTTPPADFRSLEYVYAAKAVDPDGDPLVYRLEEGPSGMTVDPDSGEVSWRLLPGTTGEYTVIIIAEDPGGAFARQQYTLNLTLSE